MRLNTMAGGEREEERGRERNQTECSNIFKDEDAITWGPGILVLWSQNETKLLDRMVRDW